MYLSETQPCEHEHGYRECDSSDAAHIQARLYAAFLDLLSGQFDEKSEVSIEVRAGKHRQVDSLLEKRSRISDKRPNSTMTPRLVSATLACLKREPTSSSHRRFLPLQS